MASLVGSVFLRDALSVREREQVDIQGATDSFLKKVDHYNMNDISPIVIQFFYLGNRVVGRGSTPFDKSESLELVDYSKVERIGVLSYLGHFYRLLAAAQPNQYLITNYRNCNECRYFIQKTHIVEHVANCRRCPRCNATMDGIRVHHCNEERVRRRQNQSEEYFRRIASGRRGTEDRQRKRIRIYEPDRRNGESIYFADFESFFQDILGNMTVYAAAILSLNEVTNPLIYYGERSLELFMMEIFMLPHDSIVYFWNGSGFDLFFILSYVLEKYGPLIIDKFLKKNNRILAMSLWTNSEDLSASMGERKLVHFKDLNLMIMCSLKNACKDFNVPEEFSKSDFDHTLIHGWNDVKTYENEVRPYLALDVLSMRVIFIKLREAMSEHFSLDVSKYVSLSHLAKAAWTVISSGKCDQVKLLTFDEDQRLRPGLVGGRTTAQFSYYYSNDNGVDDFLVYIDAVSLYPTVMQSNLFPCGNYRFNEHLMEDDDWRNERTFVCVDLECPTNLITPFIMTHDDKGNVLMNFDDKKDIILFAPELMHAIALGYRVTSYRWMLQFERSDYLFKDYITRTYDIKRQADRGSAQYMLGKLLMNSLYGKNGQKPIVVENVIISPTDFDVAYDRLLPIYSEVDGNILAYMVEKKKEKPVTTEALYLAIAILAYSHIKMSDLLIMNGSYNNVNKAFYYTDTDSLFLPSSCFNSISASIGNDLGYFKDELDGGKVLKAIFLAPKTYAFVYRDKNNELWQCIRCKGIPNDNYKTKYDSNEDTYSDELTKVIIDYYSAIKNGHLPKVPLNLRFRAYYISEDKKAYSRLTFSMFERILHRGDDTTIEVFFPSLKHHITSEAVGFRVGASITYDFRKRTLNKKDWWQSHINLSS